MYSCSYERTCSSDVCRTPIYDGDTISFTVLFTDESIKEIDDLLSDKKYYIKPDGKIIYSAANDISNLVLKHLTEDVVDRGKSDLEHFDIDRAANA